MIPLHKQIFDYIKKADAPSLEEMAEHFGLTIYAIRAEIIRLETLGYIRRLGHRKFEILK